MFICTMLHLVALQRVLSEQNRFYVFNIRMLDLSFIQHLWPYISSMFSNSDPLDLAISTASPLINP